MVQETNQMLGTAPVGSLMRRYAIPCIISLLVGALYNIVDQIFIANAAYLGSYGNAANTVVFPLTVIALAIAVMIGDGCCAFVSLSLGMGQREQARTSVGNAVLMVLACVNKACFIFLQAMGKAAASTLLSMVREIVFGVGFALLLPKFFGLDGVLYSMPLSDLLTFIIALVLILQTFRELKTSASTQD